MKKKYEKPVFIIESFQLDATIAASCSSQGFISINYGQNNCGRGAGIDKEFQYFNQHNCEIDLAGPEEDGNDYLCYHGPTAAAGMTFINS